MKKNIILITIASLMTACGDTPSDLGQQVQDKLVEQKTSFESSSAKDRFNNFLRDHTALSTKAQSSAADAFRFAQDLSAIVDPDKARSVIESGEMAIACTITMLKEKDKIDRFLDNLMQSVTDVQSKVVLLEQIEDARARVANSAINRENCLL
jgi:hypothetical protein